MVRFLISVPAELHSLLKEASKREGQTLTGYVRKILWDWVQRNEERG